MSRDVSNAREETLVTLPDAPPAKREAGPYGRALVAAAKVERAMAAIGWLAMFLIMILVTADVAMRYLFNSPLRWSFDFVSLYLMPTVFFFALTDTMRHREHVSVDIAYLAFPSVLKNVCDVLIYASAAAVFLFLFFVSGRATLESFSRGETVSGLIPWPVWLGYAPAPIGSFPVTLLCIARLFAALLRLATGRPAGETEARAH